MDAFELQEAAGDVHSNKILLALSLKMVGSATIRL